MGGSSRAVVHVHLGNGELANIFTGDLFDQRSQHAAGRTPCCPEIQKDGRGSFLDKGFEIGVFEFCDVRAGHKGVYGERSAISGGYQLTHINTCTPSESSAITRAAMPRTGFKSEDAVELPAAATVIAEVAATDFETEASGFFWNWTVA